MFSRLFLFLLFQMLLAFVLKSWDVSIKYWTLSATMTNIISIVLLYALFKHENISCFSLFRFQKTQWKTDLIWFLILFVISVPIAIIPSLALSNLFWGNTEYYHQVLFQPVNQNLLYFLLLMYPVTTGIAELPTYFGYIMPRLKIHLKANWLVIAMPVIAFSIQHCTLPLVFEAKFILFRGIMYLLFALVFGIALYKRPSLLPWLTILQILIYFLPMLMLLNVGN
jgi:hypothetical protein